MQRKYLKKIVILLGISILFLLQPSLSSAHPLKLNETTTTHPPLFSFNSYMDIEFDPTALYESLFINQSITVPLIIKYWTDIPDDFLWFLPKGLRNLVLFNQWGVPIQTIELSLQSVPSWADISLSTSHLPVSILAQYEECEVKTTLFITPYTNAPSQPYMISLKISCDSIGLLNANEICEGLMFTPSFTPSIDVMVDDQVIHTAPSHATNVAIEIMNHCNKNARVIPHLQTILYQWTPTINPPFIDISPGDIESFTFSVIPPNDFTGFQTVLLTFTVEVFPLREDSPTMEYPLYLIFYN
ncbi:MAG: hypothetical protein KAW47_07960 [Thermoplasmatales archaeon]|nr:hypothetical protein [Thermoplasmatales archaeon]